MSTRIIQVRAVTRSGKKRGWEVFELMAFAVYRAASLLPNCPVFWVPGLENRTRRSRTYILLGGETVGDAINRLAAAKRIGIVKDRCVGGIFDSLIAIAHCGVAARIL